MIIVILHNSIYPIKNYVDGTLILWGITKFVWST